MSLRCSVDLFTNLFSILYKLILISKAQNIVELLHSGLTLFSLAFSCTVFQDGTVGYGHLSLFRAKGYQMLREAEKSK